MPDSSSLFALEDFARNYIRDINHHKDIRTEHLTETFREFYGLPPFPTAADLSQVCVRIGVNLKPLRHAPEGLFGVNAWHTGSPSIYVRPDLVLALWESTLGHEIREVLENAFKRAKATYVGLETHKNNVMNRESNNFAGHLLMQSKATRDRLWDLDFDLPLFASEKKRSLPSVVVRIQELYSKRSAAPGPVAGVWLFDAPWPLVESRRSSKEDLLVVQRAHLKGFSLAQRSPLRVLAAHGLLPDRGVTAADYGLAARALDERHAVMAEVSRGGLFEEDELVVVAEPFFVRGAPWRVLVVAVRRDKSWMFERWIERLEVEVSDRLVYSAEGSTDQPLKVRLRRSPPQPSPTSDSPAPSLHRSSS